MNRRGLFGVALAGLTSMFLPKSDVKAFSYDMELKEADLHEMVIRVPEGFNGRIGVQGEDTKTSVYVFRNGLIIRRHTVPAIHCSRLERLSFPETRSSQV